VLPFHSDHDEAIVVFGIFPNFVCYSLVRSQSLGYFVLKIAEQRMFQTISVSYIAVMNAVLNPSLYL